ncbi:MAG: hypothetical protein ACRC62_39910 [Microcoleus sp.]
MLEIPAADSDLQHFAKTRLSHARLACWLVAAGITFIARILLSHSDGKPRITINL